MYPRFYLSPKELKLFLDEETLNKHYKEYIKKKEDIPIYEVLSEHIDLILKKRALIREIVRENWHYASISFNPNTNTRYLHRTAWRLKRQVHYHLALAELFSREVREIETFLKIKREVEKRLNIKKSTPELYKLIYETILEYVEEINFSDISNANTLTKPDEQSRNETSQEENVKEGEEVWKERVQT